MAQTDFSYNEYWNFYQKEKLKYNEILKRLEKTQHDSPDAFNTYWDAKEKEIKIQVKIEAIEHEEEKYEKYSKYTNPYGHIGYICSPEGSNCGLVKNKTIKLPPT